MQEIKTYLRAASVKAVLVNEADVVNSTKASLTRGMQAELILYLFHNEEQESAFTADDFANIVSWVWYADSDFDQTTTPKLIVNEGITVDESGAIHIPILETNTTGIVQYLGTAETKDLKCELAGFAAGDTRPNFILQWEFSIRNRIGAEGGGQPVPVADSNYTAAQVNALFAASNTVEYSADGGSSWSSSYTSSASLIRYRNSMISGAEWTSQSLLPGPMPAIGGGSASVLPAGSSPVVSARPVTGGYALDFAIPQGPAPVLSGGSVTTLPAGSAASAELVGSGSVYTLNLAIPQGPNGSLTVPIQPYSSDSAYQALTCIAYNGGGYQVLSATSAGENPDNAASKFVCFASSGAVGVSPVVSVTQTSSGAIIHTSDAAGSSSVEIRHGSDGRLTNSYEVVSSLVSGAIVITHDAVPVSLKTSAGNVFPIEKGTITISSGTWVIDPAAYLAYAGESSFTGPWTIYFAGGVSFDSVTSLSSAGNVISAGMITSAGTANISSAGTITSAASVAHAVTVSSAASVTVGSGGILSQTYSGGESRVILTQSAYDALPSVDSSVWYYIRED